MTMICVFVKFDEANKTIDKIANDFPCFVYVEALEDGWAEVSVNCRDEDAKAIEKRLAKWV